MRAICIFFIKIMREGLNVYLIAVHLQPMGTFQKPRAKMREWNHTNKQRKAHPWRELGGRQGRHYWLRLFDVPILYGIPLIHVEAKQFLNFVAYTGIKIVMLFLITFIKK